MDRIICLVGRSGTGKTTISRELYRRGYNVIQSYTTRPKRSEDEWGHIHVPHPTCFDSNGELNSDVIAYTYYQDHHYWATREQIDGDTIYVIDPDGVEKLKGWGIPFITIELYASDHTVRERVYNRKYGQPNPGVYDLELEKRLKDDITLFTNYKADYAVTTWLSSVAEVADEVENIVHTIPPEPYSCVGVA